MDANGIRVVAHLDMDAFYASVELLRYPDLRGEPVVIGGSREATPRERIDPATGAMQRTYMRLAQYVGRGVITTATYPARELGLHSAMGLMKAARLAPDAILLPVDFEQYRAMSRRFKAAIREIAPLVEDRGIDEVYIDLTPIVAARIDDAQDAWWCAREVAQQIRAAVRAATGLTCSVGLARNKLVAKIASELDKPDGLTLVTPDDVEDRLWPLPVRRLNGVGPKADARLAALGIRTIGDAARADEALRATLATTLGARFASWLRAAAHGRDDRPVVTASEPKSISRETTFDRDLHAVRDRSSLTPIFTGLCERLADDLQRKGYRGRTIGIKLRFEDFRTVTRDRTIEEAIDDARRIRGVAAGCLKLVDLSRRIRLLGVRVSGLERRAR
ncbi:MAG TPA: DNA polymerase IV [Burkholderiaceae bacterium]|nr:DNA polymerase IV [Burkholderiaceae bacterium]